jgi:hypothetical protein
MLKPIFIISNQTASALTDIERARGFLAATSLSDAWIRKVQTQCEYCLGVKCV